MRDRNTKPSQRGMHTGLITVVTALALTWLVDSGVNLAGNKYQVSLRHESSAPLSILDRPTGWFLKQPVRFPATP